MRFTSSTRWGRHLAPCRTQDHRAAMNVSKWGHVADATAQEAMVAKIHQEREADAQGAKDDPEP